MFEIEIERMVAEQIEVSTKSAARKGVAQWLKLVEVECLEVECLDDLLALVAAVAGVRVEVAVAIVVVFVFA